jgi:regulator of cell morphogenesis and NO signaling
MKLLQEETTQNTIGQMVAQNYRTAEVFKKHGIDFCCKGGRMLADVCKEKHLDLATIEMELSEKQLQGQSFTDTEMNELGLDMLIVHIIDHHHTYVKDSIDVMLQFLAKIQKVHGQRHPELEELYYLFEGCAKELTSHMIKEEHILFPAILKLVEAKTNNNKLHQQFMFGSLQNPINMMRDEHTTEGDRFFRIAEITNNFTPPEDACTTYKVAFKKLEEFQNDLFRHIHLENNILFPKAIALEESLNS